jgi:hypothetical protein|tara:strand:- start:295 stop:468 length:174 start_codon:yes stop_codon:yes gene_type:complete
MSKKAPEWKKANPERTDMKNVLNKTKKLTEMYLVLLKERKKQWETYLAAQAEKETDG